MKRTTFATRMELDADYNAIIKKNKKADAILTADWHLQDTTPICRLDDFWETQWSKVDFISKLQKTHNCPVLHAGDLFDYWKPSPMLLAKTIEHLPNQFWTVYGNHDLPQHQMELAYKSGINVLEKAGKVTVLEGNHWGQKNLVHFEHGFLRIMVWHIGVYQGKEPYPNCSAPKGASLIRKHNVDLIVTGDFHKPFVEQYNGRLLVNPGSIFRLNVEQIDFKPRVYLWYASTNTVEPVYLPIENGVISSDHLKAKQERDEWVHAFVEALNNDWEVGMSFEQNLKRFFDLHNTPENVIQLIYNSLNIE